jgi:glutamate synthase (NADPH/NADH) small chain
MFGERHLKLSRWGTITIDWDTMMTSLPGVFAGGDIVRGASLVVWGARDGRDAAAGIHRYLAAQAAQERPALALAS